MFNEEDYSPTGADKEVLTEISSKGVLKVSYTDHTKAYVAKVSGSDKYRSYLSLMPDKDEGEEDDGDDEEAEKREKILNEFRALSFEERVSFSMFVGWIINESFRRWLGVYCGPRSLPPWKTRSPC